MQKGLLELREIIWEITGKCYSGCSYCGSKDIRDVEINNNKIFKICDEICKFPPKTIDISGGDPFLINLDTHVYITDKLKKAGCNINILANPKNIEKDIYAEEKFSLYDWVGISINNEDELNLFKNIDVIPKNNVTIISNFNLSNLYLYNDIESLVIDNNFCWQIQFTMYKEDNQNAIYDSSYGLEKFKKLVGKSFKKEVNIVLGDNMNSSYCGAGTSSIGITYNGDVIPCLSMRSWNKNIKNLIKGNLLIESLKSIWSTAFNDYRFSEFKCCKDVCNNIIIECNRNNNNEKNIIDEIKRISYPFEPVIPNNPHVYLYGVHNPQVIMYGVKNSGVMAYAVFNPENNNFHIDYKSKKDSGDF